MKWVKTLDYTQETYNPPESAAYYLIRKIILEKSITPVYDSKYRVQICGYGYHTHGEERRSRIAIQKVHGQTKTYTGQGGKLSAFSLNCVGIYGVGYQNFYLIFNFVLSGYYGKSITEIRKKRTRRVSGESHGFSLPNNHPSPDNC